MDLTRTARVLRARWPVVVILALLGAIAGWMGAGYRNDSIEPLWEAGAPISLVEGAADEENARAGASVEDRLNEIRDLALEANRDIIDIDPDTREIETSPESGTILVNTDVGEVVFIAQARTEDEAIARASEIRQTYLTDPARDATARLNQLIGDLGDQMAETRQRIVELEGEVAGLDPNVERRAELTALLDALRGRLINFQEELLLPEITFREQQRNAVNTDEEAEPRPLEEIQADIDEVQAKIVSTETQLAAIPPPPNSDYSVAATNLRVWQQRYTDLEADFQAYQLQLEELENPVVTEEINTTDVTPADASQGLYALVGLMVGTALAAAGILSGDRLRAPVWVASDASFLPTLATVSERTATELTWYDQPGDTRRRSEIQALRAGVLARLQDRSGSVALVGSRLDSLSVRAAAADLAVAFAQSGRSVMLLDTDFDPSDGLAEFPAGGMTLAKMVVDLRAGVAIDLNAVIQVRPSLWSMPSGSFDEDPADLFAGDILDRALGVLTDRFDVVIVSAGDLAETVAQEVITRSETSLFVVSAGRSLSNELKLYTEEFTRRGANLLGMLIVTRRALPRLSALWERFFSKGTAVIAPTSTTERSDVSEPAFVVAVPAEAEEAMLEGYVEEEEPDVREPATAGSNAPVVEAEPEPRLYDVLRRPSEDGAARESATVEVANALASIDPSKAYGPMADFVADMAEEIILRPRSVGFDHDGMLPLHPVKDRTTVGSAIGRLLRDDMGAKEGAALERQIIEILFGSGPLKSVPVVRKSLDAWLSIAFFRVHAARSGREPTILHLVSPNRFFQIMVDGHRFDATHVSILADEVLPMFIEDVERQQRAARRFGSEEAIAQLDRAIADARSFGNQLVVLQTGSQPEARLFYPFSDDPYPSGWAPRWEEDVRATIAPLQRLGLLAMPLLSDEELDVMLAVS